VLVDRLGVAGGWEVRVLAVEGSVVGRRGVILKQVVSVERLTVTGGWGGEVLGVIVRGGVVVGSLAGGSGGSDWSLVGEGGVGLVVLDSVLMKEGGKSVMKAS